MVFPILLAVVVAFVVFCNAKIRSSPSYPIKSDWKFGKWLTIVVITLISMFTTLAVASSEYTLEGSKNVKESKVEKLVVYDFDGFEPKYSLLLENGETVETTEDYFHLNTSQEESTVRYGNVNRSWDTGCHLVTGKVLKS